MSEFVRPDRGLVIVRSIAPMVPVQRQRRAVDAPSDQVPEGDDLAIMEVRFAPFGTWYPISSWWEGDFVERIQKGAFKKTISENPTPRVMFNHGGDWQIDQKLLGVPSSLTEEDDSPVGVVPLWDTSYNRDLLPGIRAGGYGASFMFQALQESWVEEPGVSDWNPQGLPERTITEVRLFEFGPVTWPANPAATSGIRSATDGHYELMERSDPGAVKALRERIIGSRTSALGRAADQAPASDGLAADDGPERAADGTRTGISAAARRAAILRLGRRD